MSFLAGAVAVTTSKFSDASVPVLLTSVDCIGSEFSLLDCPFSSESQLACGSMEDAAVVCQG